MAIFISLTIIAGTGCGGVSRKESRQVLKQAVSALESVKKAGALRWQLKPIEEDISNARFNLSSEHDSYIMYNVISNPIECAKLWAQHAISLAIELKEKLPEKPNKLLRAKQTLDKTIEDARKSYDAIYEDHRHYENQKSPGLISDDLEVAKGYIVKAENLLRLAKSVSQLTGEKDSVLYFVNLACSSMQVASDKIQTLKLETPSELYEQTSRIYANMMEYLRTHKIELIPPLLEKSYSDPSCHFNQKLTGSVLESFVDRAVPVVLDFQVYTGYVSGWSRYTYVDPLYPDFRLSFAVIHADRIRMTEEWDVYVYR